jgi:hypothetical protein
MSVFGLVASRSIDTIVEDINGNVCHLGGAESETTAITGHSLNGGARPLIVAIRVALGETDMRSSKPEQKLENEGKRVP